VLVALLFAGCTEPLYKELRDADPRPSVLEAGTLLPGPIASAAPEAGLQDAGGGCPSGGCDRDAGGVALEPDAAGAQVEVDEPSTLMPGRYAILARFYGEDGAGSLGWFAEEQTVLATIERTGSNKLSLAWEICRSYTDVRSLSVRVEADLLSPQYSGVRHLELLVTGSSFRTQGDPLLIGYEPLSGADCPANSRIAKPDRHWLTDGRCTCADSDLPPTKRDDCRVIDSDMDSHPGATVRYTSGSDSYMAIRDRSQLVDGVIDPAGFHRAGYLRLGESNALQCTAGCSGPPNVNVCAPDHNPVVFQPLAELAPDGKAWTCATLQTYVVSHPFELGMPQKPDC